MIKGWWWKIVGPIILVYVIIKGFSAEVPQLNILDESIRNLFFHVPMWMAMMFMLIISAVASVLYLLNSDDQKGQIIGKNGLTQRVRYDIMASQWAAVALLYGILGLISGSIWAKVTWSAWWVFQEVKLNGAAAGVLVYMAYFVLRQAIEDEEQRARISAVYNIFAIVMYMVLINVIPRIVDSSLHPGNGGNPGFSKYDLDASLRVIFYPAVIGWTFFAAWIVDLRIRLKQLETKKLFE